MLEKMASNDETNGHLTGHHKMCLNQVISCDSIECIAVGYMGMDMEKIQNLKASRRENIEGFVRDVIEDWACRNPDNQLQNLANILYASARQYGYVDPKKIENILGVRIPVDLRG